ncbi:MAG: hypothetical protein ACYS8W_00960 [Planctomycetota bacterium]|jgi:hypothetical protein
MRKIAYLAVAVLAFSVCLLAAEVVLEKVELESGSTATQAKSASCRALPAQPEKVRPPKENVTTWAELTLKENKFYVCAVTVESEPEKAKTARLYFDRDGDGNLREEKALSATSKTAGATARFDFMIDELPIQFAAKKSRIKTKINLKLTYYDYGNRRYIYAYILDRYEGKLEEFKLNWDVSWTPGTDLEIRLENSSDTANRITQGQKQIHLDMGSMKISKDKARIKYKLQKNRGLAPVKPPGNLVYLATTAQTTERIDTICLPFNGYIFLEPGRYSGKTAVIEKKKGSDIWRLNARISSFNVLEKGTELVEPDPLAVTLNITLRNGTAYFYPNMSSKMGSYASLKKVKGENKPPVVVITDEENKERARIEMVFAGTWLSSISWQIPKELENKKLAAQLMFVEEPPFKIESEKKEFLTGAVAASPDESEKKEEDDAAAVEKLKEIEKKVNAAIEKGVKYLVSKQNSDGSFQGQYSSSHPLGYNALCALTLVKCGVPLKHASVIKAYKFLESQPRNKTYSVGLYLMALEAKYYNKKIIEKVLGRRKKKKKSGYSTTPDEEESEEEEYKPKISGRDRAIAQDLVNWLVKIQLENGCWTYGENRARSGGTRTTGDNSNMQYAILGLKAGTRLGARVPLETFLRNLKYILDCQGTAGQKVDRFTIPAAHLNSFKSKKKGSSSSTSTSSDPDEWSEPERDQFVSRGWGYTSATSTGTGSMTASGLTAVIICKSELLGKRVFAGELKKRTNESIEDGCAWFATQLNFTPSGLWWYYFMYGLERAGSLAGVRKFGTRDWYYEGIDVLLPLQKDDGRWEDASRQRQQGGANKNQPQPARPAQTQLNLCQTCFALLFLKRATIRVIKNVEEGEMWTGKGFLEQAKKKAEADKKKTEEEKKKAAEEKKKAADQSASPIGEPPKEDKQKSTGESEPEKQPDKPAVKPEPDKKTEQPAKPEDPQKDGQPQPGK